jgi:hypothetical protein
MSTQGEVDRYRGYELEDQGDGSFAIYTLAGELLTYQDSRQAAKDVIDEWLEAP